MRNILFVMIVISSVLGCSKPNTYDQFLLRKQMAERIMAKLSIDQKIGELFIIRLNGSNLNEHDQTLMRQIKPGGIIFFKNNFSQINGQLETWLQSIQRLNISSKGLPIFLTTDQESGKVVRLKRKMTSFPPAVLLGQADSYELTRNVALITAIELGAYGINMNLAPVADVNNNVDNPVIGRRSFSAKPNIVANQVTAYIDGFHQAGIATVAKHFPGHGDTHIDSHKGLPIVNKNFQQMINLELLPFQKAIKAKTDAVMSAHILFPQLDDRFPATLSQSILEGILRERLDYQDGIIISDDMQMGAITKNYEKHNRDQSKVSRADFIKSPAVLAIKAGANMLIYTGSQNKIKAERENIKRAIEEGYLKSELIENRVKKIVMAKLKLYFDNQRLHTKQIFNSYQAKKQIAWHSFLHGIKKISLDDMDGKNKNSTIFDLKRDYNIHAENSIIITQDPMVGAIGSKIGFIVQSYEKIINSNYCKKGIHNDKKAILLHFTKNISWHYTYHQPECLNVYFLRQKAFGLESYKRDVGKMINNIYTLDDVNEDQLWHLFTFLAEDSKKWEKESRLFISGSK